MKKNNNILAADRRVSFPVFLFALSCVLYLMLSCRTIAAKPASPLPESIQEISPPLTVVSNELREKVLVSAKSLVGIKYNTQGVVVNGKSFTIDCIGTLRAAFWGAGIDIAQDFYKYTGNGVSCLYYSLKDGDALKAGTVPSEGDVVFWDNTWDRNGDGVFGNDPLTHAGLIVQVDADGTCYYLHASVHAGVTIERMNLKSPSVWKDAEGKVLNSGLYLGSYYGNPKNPPKWTAGELFRAFGDSEKIIAKYQVRL